MHKEFGESVASPELDSRTDGKWLAGAFEGGLKSISFREQTKRGDRKQSVLTIELTSRDEHFIDNVIGAFGGNKYTKRAQSWRWVVTGRRAAELVVAAGNSTVFHQPLSEVTQQWIDAESYQKVMLARDLATQPTVPLTSSSYAELVKDPHFLAGVVDFHGRIYNAVKHGEHVPTVLISTRNNALLEAIQNEYGGTSYAYLQEGEPLHRFGTDMLATREARCWDVSHALARKVITVIEPYVLRVPFEGWDIVPENRRKRRIIEDLNTIPALLIKYEEEVALGIRQRMPTQVQVAEALGMSPRTYRERLRKLKENELRLL